MMTRKMLTLAIMLTILLAGMAAPVFADKGGNNKNDSNASDKADDKKSDDGPAASEKPASNENKGSGNSSDKKSDADTQSNNSSTAATPTITPVPPISTAGNSGKIKIGNLHKPVKSGPGENTTVTAPAIVSAVPAGDGKQQAEKARADKAAADGKIKVALTQLDIYVKMVNHSRLSDGDKALLIGDANENMAWYRQMGRDLQATSDGGTVQGMATDIDRQTELLRADLKRDAGLLTCDDIDRKIATARDVSALAGQKIATADTDANESLKLNQLLADYDAHVDTAAQHSGAAKASFDRITSAADADQHFDAGFGELQQAEKQLTLAYADLKEIYRILLDSQ
ncbi:hypothetical protein [Methanocella sp. MCL-LM]|uniref:hypothetical protein n=1 Tax=Methanocella sp. MCL-LM TaxID=3412035 RepID=UPI003C708F73